MALVDTQGFVMAVERSLFGPQGRKWIERKLPEVATNVAFVFVSSFGACLLLFQVSMDYQRLGLWAVVEAPKLVVNAILAYLITRALRWHIDRMLREAARGDDAVPDFFRSSRRGEDARGADPSVGWPWPPPHPRRDTHSKDSNSTESIESSDREVRNAPQQSQSKLQHRRSGSASVGAMDRSRSSVDTTLDAPVGSGGDKKTPEKGRDGTGNRGAGGDAGGGGGDGPHFPNFFAVYRHQPHDPHAPAHDGKNLPESATGGSLADRSRLRRILPEEIGSSSAIGDDHDGDGSIAGLLDEPPEVDDVGEGYAALSPTEARRVVGSRDDPLLRPTSPSEQGSALGEGPPGTVKTGVPQCSDGAAATSAAAEPILPAESPHRLAARLFPRVSPDRARRASVEGRNKGDGVHDMGWESYEKRLGGDVDRRRESEGDGWSQGRVGHGSGSSSRRKQGHKPRPHSKQKQGDVQGSRAWSDTISRALHVGTSVRRRSQRADGRVRGSDSEHQKLNFFTEDDMDELLHSTFFIKIMDVDCWLFVEDRPHQPELGWLLSLWGGYRVAPRYEGEVQPHEAHRMLFQCESGRHKGHVRIRSRATNTFLFFLGIKKPLTWVAWDRDVVGGDWEDLKLEWVGASTGRSGVLVGDERGRVIIYSRQNGYVCWHSSRFTHVQSKESATVFMLQRMTPTSSRSRRGSGRRGQF